MTANESKNSTILNSRLPDNSSKLIFDEPILCAQFLRGYIKGIPCLKDVQPEDIEDVSEQYVPLFAEERNSDRVKKVHITLLFTPRHSQNRAFSTFRCFAAIFAHEMALPSSSCQFKFSCKHGI